MHSIYVKKRSDWRISSTSGLFHLTKSEVQNRHVACSKVFGSLFVRRKLRSTEMEANLSQAAPLYHPSSLGRFLVFLFYVSPAFYETIHVFHCTQKYNASIRYMYYELNKKKLHCLSLYNCDSWFFSLFCQIILVTCSVLIGQTMSWSFHTWRHFGWLTEVAVTTGRRKRLSIIQSLYYKNVYFK